MISEDAFLGPVYAEWGKTAILTINGASHDVTVIDMTSGVEIERLGAMMPDVKPVALIRSKTLVDLGRTADELHDATLLLNGTTWTVKNTHPKPGIGGRDSGEWSLVLIDGGI